VSQAFQLPTLEPLRPVAPMSAADAQADLAHARAAAIQEGYDAGMAQAQAEVKAQFASALAAMQSAASEMVSQRDALCDAVEPAAVSLALAGAEQIVGAALEIKPELVENAARGALRRLIERDHVIMLVNPADLDHMRGLVPEMIEQLGGIESLDVQAERRVTPGSVIVQTPKGDVDARLDTRMAQLGDVVRECLAR
jgi:flagellar assembly protein FliH